jgi:hypothetical protein
MSKQKDLVMINKKMFLDMMYEISFISYTGTGIRCLAVPLRKIDEGFGKAQRSATLAKKKGEKR